MQKKTYRSCKTLCPCFPGHRDHAPPNAKNTQALSFGALHSNVLLAADRAGPLLPLMGLGPGRPRCGLRLWHVPTQEAHGV